MCSGVVPVRSMYGRATKANSATVKSPNGAVNSLPGRVHGAVDARSVYTPAAACAMTTVVTTRASIAWATSATDGSPCVVDVQTGPSPSWYATAGANGLATPST